MAASVPLLSDNAVLSHGSAAVVHGLPIWRRGLSQVNVTRDRSGGGRRRPTVHVHVAPLERGEVVQVNGYAATSLARTVVDLARTSGLDQGVAIADGALALGVPATQLQAALGRARGWPGVPLARSAIDLADGRSESVGESVSRVRFLTHGLPKAVPQWVVSDGAGVVVGRCDFAWPELRTLGEFDGRAKYGRLRRPGESVESAVYREKLREDALRDLGWQVVRWTWAELDNFAVVADRLWRAFARGRVQS
ncbi:MAG: hypothetical protein ACR2LI_08750 [Propionibacteriaceae bacterium]